VRKPVIGVAPSFDQESMSLRISSTYFEAIEDAGGIPVMLSIRNSQSDADQLLDMVNGILLPGGKDILPLYYGEDILECCGAAVPFLDEAEIMLTKSAYERGVPILGICKGCQSVNVAMGGTLYQDIAAQAERRVPIIHRQERFVPGGSYAEDGSVEAIECACRDRLVIGVQWHPEMMFTRDENARRLFRYFVDYSHERG